jgi:hypothetical protein
MTPDLFAGNELALLLIALWTLPWKGVALWKSAKRAEKKWFIALLVLNTLAILEIVYIFYFSKKLPETNGTSDKSVKPRETHDTPHDTPEKKENKQKILEALHEWKKINPNTVSRLLDTSHMTASLYLEELALEKKIVPIRESDEEISYKLK